MEQTDRKRRVRAAWRGLALVALAAAAIYAVRPRQRLLTQVARPVLKLENGREKYFWLSPDRLLLVTTLWKRDDGYDPNGVSLHPNWRGWADLLDTTTHARTRLKPFTDLLNRTGVQTDSFAVDSPDGGLYWESANGQNRTCAALLDGTHSREWTHGTVKHEFYRPAMAA